MLRLALLLAVFFSLVVAADAGACSCAPVDAREGLGRADAAVIGTVARTEVVAGRIHTVIAVERGFKAHLGAEVVVDTGAEEGLGGGCAIRFDAGRRVGMFLFRQGDAWTSGLCAQVDPAALQRAAAGPPPARGHGRVALLAAMRSEAGRLAALDARGRVLVYGRGEGHAVDVAACPGGRRAAELVATPGGAELAIRALPGLEVVRRVPLGAGQPRAVACADRRARTVLAAVGDESTYGDVVRVRGRTVRRVAVSGVEGLFGAGGAVFVATRADLRRIDAATGRATTVGSLRGGDHRAFAVAPGGGAVAVLETGAAGSTAQLHRPGRAPRTATLPRGMAGGLTWLRGDRLLLGGEGVPFRVFDRRLRERRTLPEGFGSGVRLVAGRAGTAYGVDGDQLVAASLPDLAVRRLADLPTSAIAALEPVHGAPVLRRQAAVARACPR